ncbi:restriction endonuclease subunit S [Vibrio sp. AND4]|uniref:restriction endonuclease subunit S n=1 Tax=Vibrio sp. AND4 TaxID=314289 RepID=UPI00015EFFA8|nr:restriction endonuclease subunit S [Vibrio sp. AND4]EDP59317.1 type I restriction-modification system, endonuclease S subunit [Vibrio sp. AND4]
MTEHKSSESWQMVKFGDIAKQISKRVEPNETDLKIYVGLEHLDPDSLIIKRHGVPSDVKGQKLLVNKGQIIFGKRRAYQRKIAVADCDCICSAHAMVLEANPDKVIPEFLPFFMQSDVFMNRAVAISEGSLSPTIKWKVLASQNFKIPSVVQQRKIIEAGFLLQRIQEQITDLNESAINLSNSIIQKSLNRDKVEVKKLNQLVDMQVGYAFKSKDFSDKGVALMRGANVGVSKPDWANGKKFLSNEMAKDYSEYLLNDKDIIIAMDRPFTGAGFKVSRLSKSDLPCLLVQRVGRFHSYKGITQEYLWLLLNSKFVKGYLFSQQKGMDIPHLSRKEILECEVPVLSEDEQNELSNTIGCLLSKCDALSEKRIYVRQIKKTLLG